MPVPSWVIQKREQEFRDRVYFLAYKEFRSICHEYSFDCPFSTSAMLKTYATHIINAGIKVPDGDYQPHALYFRTWTVGQIMGVEKVIRKLVPRPMDEATHD